MTWTLASAKINLALVVGPVRADGKHEVVTLLQQLTLADRIRVEPAARISVSGFAEDTIVAGILEALAAAAGYRAGWRVEIDKRIPVAAGLGGGSADAATALRRANELLPAPLDEPALHAIAAATGADVPFFLSRGPCLGTGDGSVLAPVRAPLDYAVLLALPHGAVKASTGAVYRAFDERGGAKGFDERRAALLTALARLRAPSDLAALPPNDLASSPLVETLRALGALRADVSGAGPTVYGVFAREAAAEAAARALDGRARTWVVRPRSRLGRDGDVESR